MAENVHNDPHGGQRQNDSNRSSGDKQTTSTSSAKSKENGDQNGHTKHSGNKGRSTIERKPLLL